MPVNHVLWQSPGFHDGQNEIGVDLGGGCLDGSRRPGLSLIVAEVDPYGTALVLRTIAHDSDWIERVSILQKCARRRYQRIDDSAVKRWNLLGA